MSVIQSTVASNKQAAVSAAVLETGRMANNTALRLDQASASNGCSWVCG